MKFIKKIKEFLHQIKVNRLKKKTLKLLIYKYEGDLEVELLLEKWIMKRILDGQLPRRKELAEKQARIKEMRLFIDYFSNL
jgi:hypothetical protein